MTFTNAPWAIDGALTTSALARRAQYASMSGSEGIVEPADLKVSQLTVPGNGLIIASGNAVIVNRYQIIPNEAYVVANPDGHEVLATEMPTAQPGAKSYLVLVSVGDPEFPQVGHPWMTSEVLDPEEALGFVYVRPFIMEVAAGTTSFEDLDLPFPAYALARLDIPANTTTITNAMITDLRKVARPRAEEVNNHIAPGTANTLNAAVNTYESFGGSVTVKIPKWATVAKVQAWVQSLYMAGGGVFYGDMRVNLVGGSGTPVTTLDDRAVGTTSDLTRFAANIGGNITIPPAMRGTTQTFRFEGRAYNEAARNNLKTDTRTTSFMRLRFEEAPV